MTQRNSSRLATRTRTMYLIISAFTITVLLVISAFIANGIANDASERIARQYSIEAAANFQAHINPHMTLMLQLARSNTIARWLADDYNEETKDLAFEEIIGYASYLPALRFMLTAYRTRNIYDFLPGYVEWLTREDFTSLGLLPDGEEAQWFFNTRDDELPFNLNIQREMEVQGLDPGTLQMWANHRVYYQGEFVGTIAIGFPFAHIFEPTFGMFEAGEMRGYIIDRYGGVRVDSAELMDVFYDGLPTFPEMPEAIENPNLAAHVDRHLQQRVEGIFQLGAHTFEAIQLDRGEYSHASIAPIIGMDWSVVVLSYQEGFFGFQYAPLIFAVLAVMVFSLILANTSIRRIVILPLLNLTKSAATIDITNKAELFGMERPDEIGDLARTIHQARSDLKEMHEERQRIEIMEESSKAKSRFLARMSHEIRTPITAVLGISEVELQNPKLPAAMEEPLARIYNASQLLLGIINDLLDLSKIEDDMMKLTIGEYDLARVIDNTTSINLTHMSDNDTEFVLHVENMLPAKLMGDQVRIEQILNNIVSNAIKYTEKGKVELSFRREAGGKEGFINLIITVRDTGVGMTEDQLAVIFDEYTRFYEKGTKFISGAGLGMPIVSKLIQMMDADIKLESEIGVGTTVTVTIPQEVSGTDVLDAETVQGLQQFKTDIFKTSRQNRFTPERMPYGRVLVVDDVEVNLYVVKGLLALYEIEVETCNNGYAAVEKIQQGNTYDIIFMDHMMPEISGIDAVEIIRGHGYKEPIIALTANVMFGNEEKFILSGFDGYLSKPIRTEFLNSILEKHIRDKQPPEVLAAARQIKITAASLNADATSLIEPFLADADKALKALEPLMQSEELDSGVCGIVEAQAHAIKSALTGIGNSGLAGAAFMLEKAAHMSDMSTIKAITPQFLINLREVIMELSPEPPGEYVAEDDTGFLRDSFNILADACRRFDIKTADSVIEQLRQKTHTKKTQDLIAKISTTLLYGDFNKVISLITE